MLEPEQSRGIPDSTGDGLTVEAQAHDVACSVASHASPLAAVVARLVPLDELRRTGRVECQLVLEVKQQVFLVIKTLAVAGMSED